jgi:hypothetical protein
MNTIIVRAFVELPNEDKFLPPTHYRIDNGKTLGLAYFGPEHGWFDQNGKRYNEVPEDALELLKPKGE